MASSRTGGSQWIDARNYHLKHARANGLTQCPLCSNTLDWEKKEYPNRPEVDHILPAALGGTNAAHNLRVICAGCNRRMGAKLGSQIRRGLTPDQARPTSNIPLPADQELRTSRKW